MPVTIFPSTVTVISGTVAATQGTIPWAENLAQVGGSPVALGQNTGAKSIPAVLASDQLQLLDIATASRQDVLIALLQALSQLILNCDTSNVNIAGGQIVVSAMPTVQANVAGAVAVTSAPLPPNAAQEAGGNLDQLVVVLQQLNATLSSLSATDNLVVSQLNNIAAQIGAQSISYQ